MAEESLVSIVLDSLWVAAQFLPRPFETKYAWARRLKYIDPDKAYRTLNHLEKRGMVKVEKRGENNFVVLTSKGELAVLLKKASIKKEKKWDGKWRLIISDITEDVKHKRREFRILLKRNGFIKLQASVYASPYSLNREAIAYLQKSGLMAYIRILKVEEMDNDVDLKKKFKLASLT